MRKNLPQFVACFNLAYQSKFRFFVFNNYKNLSVFFDMFENKGLIHGFYYINNIKVVLYLKYLLNLPFFKVYLVSKKSRIVSYRLLDFFRGSLTSTSLYILSNSSNRFFFSDVFFSKYFCCSKNQGGLIILKILFLNANFK